MSRLGGFSDFTNQHDAHNVSANEKTPAVIHALNVMSNKSGLCPNISFIILLGCHPPLFSHFFDNSIGADRVYELVSHVFFPVLLTASVMLLSKPWPPGRTKATEKGSFATAAVRGKLLWHYCRKFSFVLNRLVHVITKLCRDLYTSYKSHG